MKNKYKNKKVAVILGFYNGNDYIETQVKSILEQEFKNIDIYIFDDNSTLNVELKKIKSDKNTKCKIKIFKGKECWICQKFSFRSKRSW